MQNKPCVPCQQKISTNPLCKPDPCDTACEANVPGKCITPGIAIGCLNIKEEDSLVVVLQKIGNFLCGYTTTSTSTSSTTSTSTFTTTSTSTSTTTINSDILRIETLSTFGQISSVNMLVQASNFSSTYLNANNLIVQTGISVVALKPQTSDSNNIIVTNNSLDRLTLNILYSQDNGNSFSFISGSVLESLGNPGSTVNIPNLASFRDNGANGPNVLRFIFTPIIVTTTTTSSSSTTSTTTLPVCIQPTVISVIYSGSGSITTTSTTTTTTMAPTTSTTSTTTTGGGITVFAGYFDEDPYAGLVVSDALSYQLSNSISNNTPVSFTFPTEAEVDKYIVYKVPNGQSIKTTYVNGFQNGSIPDSVIRDSFVTGGFTYYVSRVPMALDTTQPLVIS